MEDEDFLAPSQFARTQHRSNSTNLSQAVTSSSMSRSANVSQRASQPSQARAQTSQTELSQIQDGLRYLMDRVQQLSGDRSIKRPAEAKPLDKQPDVKQECQICHKLYANKTTLFRHYRGIHQEMNPEKYHGCSVNSTVVSLDSSIRESQCSICDYSAPSQNALENHFRTTHSNEFNANSNRTANNDNVTNKENANGTNKNSMHKCDECACYFEERSKFDEHMKTQHGFEVVCKICNKHLFFKDIDKHVKDSHPDIYKGKRRVVSEKNIIVKVLKNRKGNKVRVYICTKCDIKMYDKVEADNHDRGHKRLKNKVAPSNKVAKDNETTAIDDVILTCVDCNISTGSYDAAVEHSQNHITNAKPVQFVTQLCEICDLKFEPLCYKKHIDLHYKNKEIHKESFKYFRYRFEFLTSEKWFDCFDKSECVVKKMISESVYEHTRVVKMRVLQEGTCRLYKCCKCDDFVEPAAVLNHTVNYDTCVKVKCSYPCNICKRTFNNRLTRNNHVNNHKSEEAYKIVLFNHTNDKALNEKLNSFKYKHSELAGTSKDNDTKVLYKCICGLCFVRKDKADKHTTICPSKDDRNPCPKCGNLFNQEELVAHCFEHHLDETRIFIETITPEVIVIDSDEEIIEIDSSDEEEVQNEQQDQIEVMKTGEATIRGSSKSVAQNLEMPEATTTASGVGNEALTPILHVGKVEDENNYESEASLSDNDSVELDNEMTDDDSRDTISYDNTEIDTNQVSDTNNRSELKLVPTSLLLNPLHFESGLFNIVDTGLLNAQLNSDIENVRQHIEATSKRDKETEIKQEKPWLCDPTDFSNICRRPSLRAITMQPSSSNLSLEVESLLTDDEEMDIIGDKDKSENNVRDDVIGAIVTSNAPTVIVRTNNDMISGDMSYRILHIIPSRTFNHVKESRVVIKDTNNRIIQLNKEGYQKVIINNATQIINKETEINEDSYSDDDLFLPSGCSSCVVAVELNNIEKEIRVNEKLVASQVVASSNLRAITNAETVTAEDTTSETANVNSEAEQINNAKEPVINQVVVSSDLGTITNTETETTEVITSEKEIINGEGEQINSVIENIESLTEDTNKTSSDNNDSINTDCNTNERGIAKDIDRGKKTDREGKDKRTVNSEDTPIADKVNYTPLPDTSVNQSILTDVSFNIKKEYTDINIKKELVEETDINDNVNNCDNARVNIKQEPNDTSDVCNENEEHGHLVRNVPNENYNNCNII